MRNLITVVVMVIGALIFSSCVQEKPQQPPLTPEQKVAQQQEQQALTNFRVFRELHSIYVQDPRTQLCFLTWTTANGHGYRYYYATNVPCTQEVMQAMKNQ